MDLILQKWLGKPFPDWRYLNFRTGSWQRKNTSPEFEYVLRILHLFLVSAWCAQSACLPHFADLKKTPPGIWSMWLLYVINLCFRSLLCRISMPAALRQPQKKPAQGICEHGSCVFCKLLLLCSWLLRNGKNNISLLSFLVSMSLRPFLCVFFRNFLSLLASQQTLQCPGATF